MKPINNENENELSEHFEKNYQINWNWLYLRSHLVFAVLVFVGMLVFVWWITT